MWAIVGVVPVVAAGAAYSMGAFSTDLPKLTATKQGIQQSLREFSGDDAEISDPTELASFRDKEQKLEMLRRKEKELNEKSGLTGGKSKKKKTKKAKKNHKKTIRKK